ncbi:MAG: DsbA family oxidoreductase [Mycobacteriales bacterium]
MSELAAAPVNPDPGVVTVWSDIGCPWATLSLHVLHQAVAASGVTLIIDHRAFPLELFNHRPTPKVIVDSEVVAIAGLVPGLGWRTWSAPESTYPVTMLPALEAVQAAKHPEAGGLAASDELDTALRVAFYVEHACISIPGVILDVASGCPAVDTEALARLIAAGAGRPQVYHQYRQARSDQIQGSPHLFAVGFAQHNPGVNYHWTQPPPWGFPRLDSYSGQWAEELVTRTASG